MALELVGAVGVKVRPDTKGFREKAKREILDQLRDLEADLKVNVNPRVNQKNLDRELDDRFDDLPPQDVERKVNVSTVINDDGKSLEDKISEQLPDEHKMRVDLETSEASKRVNDLEDEIKDLDHAMSKLPESIEGMDKEFESMQKNIERNIHDAEERVGDLEQAVDDLGESRAQNDATAAKAAEEQAKAESRLRDLLGERGAAEKDLENLRAEWRAASGRDAKTEVAERRKAAEERVKQLAAEQRELEKTIKAQQRAGEAARKMSAADSAELSKKEAALKRQWSQLDGILDTEREITKANREAAEAARAQLDAANARVGEANKELDVQREILEAHKRTDEELEHSVTHFDPLLQKLAAWRTRLTEVERESGKNAAMQKGYYGQLAYAHSDMTARQIADIQEYEKRQLESIKRVEAVQREAARVRNAFNFPKSDGAMRQIENQLNSLERRKAINQVVWVDPRLDKVGLERQLAFLHSYLDKVKAGEVEITPVLNERTLSARINDLQRRIANGGQRAMLPFEQGMRSMMSKNQGWVADFGRSISGLGVMNKIMADFKNGAANLDEFGIAAARTSTKLTALSGVALATVGSVAHLASDLGKLAGGALLIPSAFFAAGATIYSLKKGFEGFKGAMEGSQAVMSGLPDSMNRAAVALRDMLGALDDVVQPAMWRGIGDSMAEAFDAMTKPMVRGLEQTSLEVGHFIAGMSRSFEAFAKSGNMDKAFDGMNKGFGNATKGAEPLFNAINMIGAAGARHLPALGEMAANAAKRFELWAEVNQQLGNFDRWIRQAGETAGQLGSVVGDTVGVISNLGRAAENAGLPGLGSLANAMKMVNDATQGAFFQGHMTEIFRAAGEMSRDLAEGFGSIGRGILEQSDVIAYAMGKVGDTFGRLGQAIGENLGNERLRSGITRMFDDISAAGGRMADSMPAIIGNLGDFAGIAGAVVDGGSRIAQAFIEAWNKSSDLSGAIERLIPTLSDLVANFVTLVHVPLNVLADGAAAIIDVFNGMPGPIQNAIAALALFTIGGGKVASTLMKFRTGAGLMVNAMDLMASRATGVPGKMGSVARETERAGAAASKSGGFLRTAATNLGLFGTAAATAQGKASAVAKETDAAGRAASGAVGGFGKVAGAAGSSGGAFSKMGSLARGAGSMIMGAFGPVGIAIAGIGTVTAIASDGMQRTAEATDNFSKSLDNNKFATEQMASTVEGRLGQTWSIWDRDLRTLGQGVDSTSDTLGKLGMSSGKVADMLRNDRGSYDELAEAMSGVNDTARIFDPSGVDQKLDVISRATGKSKEELKGMLPIIQQAGQDMQATATEFSNSGVKLDAFGNVMAPLSEQSRTLGESLRTLGDASASMADKTTAMGGVFDVLSTGMASITGAELGATESIGRMKKGASDLASTFSGDLSSAFVNGSTKIDTTSDSAVQLARVLSPLGQTARETAEKLAGEGKIDEAVQSYGRAKDEWMSMGKTLGLTKDQMSAAWDQIVGATPEELKSTLTLEGMENIDKAEEATKRLGLTFDKAKYVAFLEANAEQFKREGTSAEEQVKRFAASEYVAKVKADASQLDGVMDAAKAKGIDWDKQKFMAWLEADPANALLAAEDAEGAARRFAADQYQTYLKADGTDVTNTINDINGRLQNATSGSTYEFHLTGNKTDFDAVMGAAEAKGIEISQPDRFKAWIGANADQFNSEKLNIEQVLALWEGQPTNIKVGGDTTDADLKIGNLKGSLNGLTGITHTTRISETGALDVQSKVQTVTNTLNAYGGKNYSATVSAVDSASSIITIPKAKAEQYAKQYNGQIVATDGASAVIAMPKDKAEAFQKDYHGTLSATDGASHIIQVPKALANQYVKQYNGKITATDGATSTIAIPQNKANQFVKDYNSSLSATDGASGAISSVQQHANDLENTDPNSNLSATDNASGTIGSIRNMLNNIPRSVTSTIDVITNRITNFFSRKHADGGFSFTDNDAFADGGFHRGRKRPNVHKFANGGHMSRADSTMVKAFNRRDKEQHLAQIAMAATPFRVWAEPETGGEAYIPLASSKRARSTRIWEETGNRLQVDWGKYANGGVTTPGGNQNRTLQGAADGGSTYNVNVTNNYPQAEPASRSINRGLQLTSNL